MKTEQQLLLTKKCNFYYHVNNVLEEKSYLWLRRIFSFFSGFIAAVKKHRGIPFNFVQFYEMHTNDIIMVTGSNAHMQIKIQRYVQT